MYRIAESIFCVCVRACVRVRVCVCFCVFVLRYALRVLRYKILSVLVHYRIVTWQSIMFSFSIVLIPVAARSDA
jgi:uncharacterized membrane protein YesL